MAKAKNNYVVQTTIYFKGKRVCSAAGLLTEDLGGSSGVGLSHSWMHDQSNGYIYELFFKTDIHKKLISAPSNYEERSA